MLSNHSRPVISDLLRQAFCGLHGHDEFLQLERERMFLRCISCGHESPGWSLADSRPVVTVRAAVVHGERRRLARHPFVTSQRTA